MNHCLICPNAKEDDYQLCRDCIRKTIRVCTCDKKFGRAGVPNIINMGNADYLCTLIIPAKIPDFFLSPIRGNLYHILACRGCRASIAKKQISVQEDFEAALQASIVSCVYQKIDDDSENHWEYLSDSLDEVFEKYLADNGLTVGEPAGIEVP